jgi:hypothetical protein
MTPDELARHLSDVAKEHGATLTDLTFLTHLDGIRGTHSYQAIMMHRIDSPLPDAHLRARE